MKQHRYSLALLLLLITATHAFAQVPTNGLQLWLRADSVIITNNAVSQVYDLSGNNRHATQPTPLLRPTRIVSSADFGGRPVLNFSTNGNTGFQFPRITNIRTVFMVVQSADINTRQFLLGDSTLFDFHGGMGSETGGATLFNPQFTSQFIVQGAMRYDGVNRNPSTTLRPTTPTIITLQTSGNVTAGLLSFDRPALGNTTANRSWRGQIAEVLIYSDSLNNAQRAQIESYLAARYGRTLGPNPPIASSSLELWFRADYVTMSGPGSVTEMSDLSGKGRFATQSNINIRPLQNLSSSAFVNRPTLSYSSGQTSLSFARVSNIRTVFMVAVSSDTTNLQFMLGDTQSSDFHGGGNGQSGGTLFSDLFASPNILNGRLFYNGAAQNPRTALRPLQPTVITLQTTGNVAASTMNQDRFLIGRSWRGEIAELLIFSDSLIASQRDSVNSYLAQRYAITLSTPNPHASQQPKSFVLEQNYPNPFNPTTTIRYSIPQAGEVSLSVYDVLGRRVATLVNERRAAGNYEVPFNASSLASGVYFYRLQSGSAVETKKMMLMK